MCNLYAKLPEREREPVKQAYWRALDDAISPSDAKQRLQALVDGLDKGGHAAAVRRALASPLPPVKRSPSSRPAPKLGAYRAIVDGWLEADRAAPRKQRHTAKRIWRRLVDEHGADVAETTVRDYVRARRRAIGWPAGELFVPRHSIRVDTRNPVAELGARRRRRGRAP